jgi:SNF2 family DNA or RNA helicase
MKLLPHQIEDAAFLAARPKAAMFSEMGTGKTRAALEAIQLIGCPRVLIIAPPIALTMWSAEAEDHLVRGTYVARTGTDLQKLTAADNLVITTYALATKFADRLRHLGWGVMICDESHALKSIGTAAKPVKRTKAILGDQGIHRNCEHVWLLTGTPVTRWADDLYPAMRSLWPEKLDEIGNPKSLSRFRMRYCITQLKRFHPRQPLTQVVVGSRNLDELNELLFGEDPVAVRRRMKDVVADMPALTYSTYTVAREHVEGLTNAWSKYSGMSDNELVQSLSKSDEGLATVRRLLGMSKVKAAAAEIIDQVEAGHRPLLVFAWHRDVIDGLQTALQNAGLNARTLTGATRPHDRDRAIASFNDKNVDVLVAQLAAAGVSINLQKGGSRCIFVERDWSPANMSQAIARLWRMGQLDHVQVDYFDSDHKLDQIVATMLARKAGAHARIVGDAA